MPQKRIARTCALTLFSLLLVPILGCSAVVSETDAVGTYKANPDWGTSTLILAKDHSFEQTVHLNTGQSRTLHGMWRINNNPGNPPYTTINLTPFFKVTHDKQVDYTLASSCSIYHVPFGGVNIAADPNYGIAFRK